jgi:hypothetical protein
MYAHSQRRPLLDLFARLPELREIALRAPVLRRL